MQNHIGYHGIKTMIPCFSIYDISCAEQCLYTKKRKCYRKLVYVYLHNMNVYMQCMYMVHMVYGSNQ